MMQDTTKILNTSRFITNSRTIKMISHEVPLEMMPASRWFNDYDYALVHLFENHPEYLKFYEESLRMGRMVILDNSLYELGKAFDPDKYLGWINRLKPTYYIIPDAFWDADATIGMAMEWMTNQGRQVDPGCKPIGVAQGSTYDEVVRSYRFFESIGVKYIAFTFKFHPDMYYSLGMDKLLCDNHGIVIMVKNEVLGGDDLIAEDKASIMRYVLLKKLQDDKVINPSIKHHLLGLQNTTFLDRICNMCPWVTSIDTSNPVTCAMEGLVYQPVTEKFNSSDEFSGTFLYIGNGGLPKPHTTIDGVFDKPVNPSCIQTMIHNIHAFRELVNPDVLVALELRTNQKIKQLIINQKIKQS